MLSPLSLWLQNSKFRPSFGGVVREAPLPRSVSVTGYFVLLAPLLIVPVGMLPACKSEKPKPAPETTTQPTGRTDSYVTRGILRSVKTSVGANAPTLVIEHEEITEFKNRDGDKVGMPSMRMPFELQPGLKSDQLTPGNRVSLTFDLVWGFPNRGDNENHPIAKYGPVTIRVAHHKTPSVSHLTGVLARVSWQRVLARCPVS